MPELNRAAAEVLLLEYVLGQLTGAKKKALESYLAQSPELQNKLRAYQAGLQYLERLKQIKIQPNCLPAPTPKIQWVESLLKQLHHARFWLGPAFLVVLAISFKFYIDQSGLRSDDQVLVQTHFHRPAEVPDVLLTKTKGPLAQDESIPPKAKQESAVSQSNVVTSPQTSAVAKVEKQARMIDSISEIKSEATSKDVGKNNGTSANLHESVASSSNKDSSSPTQIAGYVWRGRLQVQNLEDAFVRLQNTLATFQPKRGGQVELGWKKSEGVRYYHFTTALHFEEAVQKSFGELGVLTWVKESHPRKMPAGVSRYIVEVIEIATP